MELEQEAKELGWVPQENFKGDPSKWVDAETFVARGKEVMPILRKNNERLLGEVETLKGSVTELKSALTQAQESLEEFRKYNEDVAKKSYEKAVRELKEQRKTALKEGDGERVVVIEEALEELDEQEKSARPAPKAPEAKPQPAPATLHPDYKAWEADNASWLKDEEKKTYAMSMAQYLRSTTKATGREFLDLVSAEVESRFGRANGTSKVEGGTRETGRSGRNYSDLPLEARQACDRMAGKLVGPNRAFRSMEDWRKSYVSNYDWS